MAQPPAGEVTPKLIVEHILAAFHANKLEGFESSFVPNVFVVYLAPDVLNRLKSLEGRIRDQALRALERELSKLNRPGLKVLGLAVGTPSMAHEALGEFRVEFRTNADEDAALHPVLVHAEARDVAGNPPPAANLLEGSATVRVTPAGAADDGKTLRTAPMRPGPAQGAVYATLRYEDDTGPQTFSMVKDLIKAGRGGRDYLIDLKLVAKKDISQEHFQIRRDPATGAFFIKDMSRYGTWVNGKRVDPSVDRTGPELRDLLKEEPLPESAMINLADVLTLQFKAARKR